MDISGKTRIEKPESSQRRRFLRECTGTLAKAAAVIFLVESGLGCPRSYYARIPERASELGHAFDNITAEQLGFVQGSTTIDEAVRLMQSRGFTHIEQNSNITDGGRSVCILTADFQHAIHIFKDRRYERSVGLAINAGELPHRYLLRVADYDNAKMLIALIRDSVGIEHTRLAVIPYANGTVGAPSYVDLSDMERRNGGMQYPIFVGYDLKFGITFIARDRGGVPWESGYILSWDGSRLHRRAVPFERLIECDCIRTWAEGQ